MSWCPNCKIEYRDGFQKCSDCGAWLVDERPPEEPEPARLDKIELALLADFGDPIQADMLKALLKDAGIPFLVRHSGAGQAVSLYMGVMGTGISGTQILISAEDLERAQELLYVVQGEGEIEDTEEVIE
jgi:hypothetical protein